MGVVEEGRGGGTTSDDAGSSTGAADGFFSSTTTSTSISCDGAGEETCSTTTFSGTTTAACLISNPNPSPIASADLGESTLAAGGDVSAESMSEVVSSTIPAARAFWFAFFLAFLIVFALGPGPFLILSLTFLSMARAGAMVGIEGDSGRRMTSLRSERARNEGTGVSSWKRKRTQTRRGKGRKTDLARPECS